MGDKLAGEQGRVLGEGTTTGDGRDVAKAAATLSTRQDNT